VCIPTASAHWLSKYKGTRDVTAIQSSSEGEGEREGEFGKSSWTEGMAQSGGVTRGMSRLEITEYLLNSFGLLPSPSSPSTLFGSHTVSPFWRDSLKCLASTETSEMRR
jgi:hypothetical protein